MPLSGFTGSQRGQSLLLTLMILAATVILFTILARVVMVDQRVTKGYSEILRSEMAAKAGSADAENLLLQLFVNYPDSATYWEPNIADATTPLPGTVFMFRDLAPDQAYAGTSTTAPKIYARPLVSGSRTQEFYPINNFDQTLPDPTDSSKTINLSDPTLAIDLNAPSTFDSKDPNGWIGAVPGTTPVSTPVPWVNILADPTKPEDMTISPATHQPNNPAVARYAFWIDDESFKINVNTVQGTPRGLASAETKTGYINGASATVGNPQPSLQGMFASTVSNISDVSTAVVAARNALIPTGGHFLSPLQIGHSQTIPTGSTAQSFGRDYKFLATTMSTGLNLSQSGFKRLNLNDLVARSGATSKTSIGTTSGIQQAIGQIVTAINTSLPHFGQRFYRVGSTSQMIATSYATTPQRNALSVLTTPTGTAVFSDEAAYVEKIAANIFDYVSPSANPTVLDKKGNVLTGAGIFSLTDPKINYSFPTEKQINPLLAIGKKAVPYFTEYMMHAKIVSYTAINPTAGTANFQIEIDHYFEFWNMTNKDIVVSNGDLGSNPFIIMENQPPLSMDNAGPPGPGDIPLGRPFEIKLSDITGLTFKAGSFTVITTDPNWTTNGALLNIQNPGNVYIATKFYRPGTTTEIDSGVSAPPYPPATPASGSNQVANIREYACVSGYANNGDEPEVQMGPNWSKTAGTSTPTVILGNDNGLFGVTVGLNMTSPIKNGIAKPNFIPFHGDGGGSESLALFATQNYFRGSYLMGNYSENCDPRSSFEALTVDAGTQTVPYAGSGWNVGAASSGDPGLATIANTLTDFPAEIANGTNLGFWASDIAVKGQSAADAPMVIAQGPMMFIGELGNVYDPMRYDQTAAAVATDRGGGRTLTIGQPDVVWDGTRPSSATQPEMSFQVSRSRGWAAWRLPDIFTVKEDTDMAGTAKAEVSGLFNPNGILRDNGQALQALVQGITFGNSPDSDPALAGLNFDTTNMTTLVKGTATNLSLPSVGAGGQALASYLAERLTRGTGTKPATFFSPIWEPGELSQLYMLDPLNPKNQIVSTVKASNMNDRGHEELCRRLMDLITPKGNTFTIYVVGQALNQLGNVTSTKAERVTVRLRPTFNPPLNDSFDPTQATEVSQRFRKPDNYILEVIQVEDAS